MADLGSRIKQARIRRGLTQETLGELICRCPSAISGYENNTQVPPADTLLRLAMVLDLSVDSLVGYNNSDTYSLHGLSDSQKDIVCSIINELKTPSSTGQLSQKQMIIIGDLINQFTKQQ